MGESQLNIDRVALKQLEDRLRRGIPKWEQPYFIELVVPQLVARLQKYEELNMKT